MTPARMGQHHLANAGVAEKIVGLIPEGNEPILEIGPGGGVLTRPIAERFPGRRLVAVEKDRRLAAALRRHAPAGVEILEGDILRVRLADLFGGTSICLVGNIPYHISGRIVDWLARQCRLVHAGVLMTQREFARKLLPGEADSHGGARSILFDTLFAARPRFDVRPGSFRPPPRVASTVFSFSRREPGLDEATLAAFGDFLSACFRSRRKTLLNNLKTRYAEETLRRECSAAGIPVSARAESLPAPTLLRLHRNLTAERGPRA